MPLFRPDGFAEPKIDNYDNPSSWIQFALLDRNGTPSPIIISANDEHGHLWRQFMIRFKRLRQYRTEEGTWRGSVDGTMVDLDTVSAFVFDGQSAIHFVNDSSGVTEFSSDRRISDHCIYSMTAHTILMTRACLNSFRRTETEVLNGSENNAIWDMDTSPQTQEDRIKFVQQALADMVRIGRRLVNKIRSVIGTNVTSRLGDWETMTFDFQGAFFMYVVRD